MIFQWCHVCQLKALQLRVINMKEVTLVVFLAAAILVSTAYGRQYNQIKNQLLTPSESTGEEVLKELGVDLKNEGRILLFKVAT